MEKIILAKAPGLQQKSWLIHNWSDEHHVKPVVAEESLFFKDHPEFKEKLLFVYSGNMGAHPQYGRYFNPCERI